VKIKTSLKLSLAALMLSALVPLGCTRTREAGPMIEVPAGTFVQGWQADLDLRRNPVTGLNVVGDQLLVSTRNNLVYALSVDGGAIKWSSQVLAPDRTLGTPALVGDKIVFPTSNELIVYNKMGRREKEIELNRSVRSAITGEGDFVYLGVDYGSQGRLSRVSLTAPYVPVRWELMTRGAVSSAPAVFQNVIYVASEDGNVYAVTDERLAIWPLPGNVFSTGSPIRADLKVDDTGLYVSGTDSKLYALDRVTGKIRWQYFAGTPLRSAPTLTSDSVYQYVRGRGVVALDKLTGAHDREPRWTAEYATAFIAADAQHVFLRGNDNAIVAVEKATGSTAFKSQRDDLTFTAGGTGTVFAATTDGVIISVKPVKSGGVVGQVVLVPAGAASDFSLRIGG